jgi:hypothetical protein
VGHAKRLEDSFAYELVPGLASDGGDNLACYHEHQVVIGILAAQARCGVNISRVRNDVITGEGGVGPEHEVARAEAESATVRERIAHSELVVHVGVVHMHARQVVGDRFIPFHLAFVDEHRDGRSRECLCIGGDAE